MDKTLTTSTGFESWAIVEVFGHVTYAGRVDEIEVAGGKMIRITVPAIEANGGLPEFQKIYGKEAIYSITPVSEDYAKRMAEELRKHPVEGYQHKEVVTKMAKAYAHKITLNEVKKLLHSGQIGNAHDEIEEDEY